MNTLVHQWADFISEQGKQLTARLRDEVEKRRPIISQNRPDVQLQVQPPERNSERDSSYVRVTFGRETVLQFANNVSEADRASTALRWGLNGSTRQLIVLPNSDPEVRQSYRLRDPKDRDGVTITFTESLPQDTYGGDQTVNQTGVYSGNGDLIKVTADIFDPRTGKSKYPIRLEKAINSVPDGYLVCRIIADDTGRDIVLPGEGGKSVQLCMPMKLTPALLAEEFRRQIESFFSNIDRRMLLN